MLLFTGLGILLFLVPVVNRGVFLVYAADKQRAASGRRRIYEGVLFCGALVGPFGALVAMQLFRHKTQKVRFFVVPLVCILQALIFLWLFSGSS